MTAWVKENSSWLIDSAQLHPRVLSVGGGNGDFDCAIIPFLAQGRRGLSYEVIEPNEALRQQFESAASSTPQASFNFHASTLEEYRSIDSADLVLMSHCLYYIPEREAALRRALSIAPRVLIFNSTAYGLAEVRERFQDVLSGNPSDYFTSKHLKRACHAIGARVQSEILPSCIDITSILSEPEANRPLLSFLVGCDCSTLPTRECQKVADFLGSICFEEGGKNFLLQPVAAVIVERGQLNLPSFKVEITEYSQSRNPWQP